MDTPKSPWKSPFLQEFELLRDELRQEQQDVLARVTALELRTLTGRRNSHSVPGRFAVDVICDLDIICMLGTFMCNINKVKHK